MSDRVHLTNRDSQIIEALTQKVRLFAQRQIAEHWFGGEMVNARRRLKRLAAIGLVTRLSVQARPLPPLERPLACWRPGEPEPDFGAIAYRCQEREMVSKRLGESTIMIENYSNSRGGSTQYPHLMTAQNWGSSGKSWNKSSSTQQLGRALLKTEEVMRMNERVAIVFTPGLPPIKSRLVRYYESGFSRIMKPQSGASFKALIASFVVAVISGLMALVCFAAMQQQAEPQTPPMEPLFLPEYQPGFQPFPFDERDMQWPNNRTL